MAASPGEPVVGVRAAQRTGEQALYPQDGQRDQSRIVRRRPAGGHGQRSLVTARSFLVVRFRSENAATAARTDAVTQQLPLLTSAGLGTAGGSTTAPVLR